MKQFNHCTDNDSGTTPIVTFDARKTGASVSTRPLFHWTNANITQMLMDADGNLGIGNTSPSGKLDVNGQVYVSDIPVGTGSVVYWNSGTGQLNDGTGSSIHFKENVEDLEFDKEAFLSLRPVRFDWKAFYGGDSDVGFIAQETETAFAPLCEKRYAKTYLPNGDVLRDSLNLPIEDTTQLEPYGFKYHKLPIYLFALAQEQQHEIDSLTQIIEQLANVVQSCCEIQPNARYGNDNSEDLLNENKTEVVLLQNDPNPFSDFTDIKYSNTGCGNCELIVTDLHGRIVKRVPIGQNSGFIRIYSSEIGSGFFSYSILEGGQLVASGKMVSSK